jgi:hypothetical protein
MIAASFLDGRAVLVGELLRCNPTDLPLFPAIESRFIRAALSGWRQRIRGPVHGAEGRRQKTGPGASAGLFILLCSSPQNL